MRTFKINGIEYNAKPFDMNMACDLEDKGVALGAFVSKPNVAMRAYLSVCGNMSLEKAGLEMNAHFVNGNDLGELAEAMNAEIDNSDFFQQILRKTKEVLKAKKTEK